MLDLVRTKQKSFLIKIAFGLIILSFVIGYTMLTSPNKSGGPAASDVAASVNGDDISYASFQQTYSNLYNLYQSIYQGNFNAELERQLNLPKVALGQLVDELLLIQQADKLGLSVSSQELIESIAQYDAFKVNGSFNRDRYIEVLNYQRMSPEQFETAQHRQLLTQKVRTKLQEGINISDTELVAAFHKDNDKINLNYVLLTPAVVENKVEVTDEGLAAFFDQNIDQFRIAEKVSLRYLQFVPARYEDQVGTLSAEDIDTYYRRNPDQFEIKEEVKAAHILVSVPQDADAETVSKRRDFAASLLKQIQEGADFAELAKANSDDKVTAVKGGELGTFGRGAMVSEFDQAAFNLRPGQLSDLVRTQFGFHIIKVEEYTAPGLQPQADAIDKIKAGLTAEKARQIAYEKAVDAFNMNRKTGDLEAAAKANDLGIKETGMFTRGQAIDGIGRVAAISDAAFTLKDGELAQPIQTPQGIFLIAIKERLPSRLPELDEVKPAVELAYRAEQAETLARQLAEKLLAAAKENNDLAAAAKDEKLILEESGDFSRSFGAFIPRIGTNEELAEEAFTLTADAPVASKVYEIGNRMVVAALKEAKVADFATLDEAAKNQLSERLLADKKDQVVKDKLDELKQQADITVYVPELADAFTQGAK
ncbi:MAG: hypothetical protein C0622_12270 [Desulfuromonas sp.]|nr:MAG: hypothetical protein C0622_12270 [Desulfuromonas sp.]